MATKQEIAQTLKRGKGETHEEAVLKRWDMLIDVMSDIKIMINKGRDE